MRYMWLLDLLFPPREHERLVRDTEHLPVSPRLIDALPTVALLSYRDPHVKAAILEAKFHGNTRAQHLLGRALHEYLHEQEGVIVPIPLSKERLKERGYNQVERICSYTGLPVTHVLTRVRNTRPQTSLTGTERKEALQGAFTAHDIDPSLLYIVVDDVTTTGATLRSAVAALGEAGAKHIYAIALAQ